MQLSQSLVCPGSWQYKLATMDSADPDSLQAHLQWHGERMDYQEKHLLSRRALILPSVTGWTTLPPSWGWLRASSSQFLLCGKGQDPPTLFWLSRHEWDSRCPSPRLPSSPSLIPTLSLWVEVDASDVRIGAVVSQRSPKDNKLHLCAFLSRHENSLHSPLIIIIYFHL